MPHECELEFYKVYTKSNCEQECRTKITLNSCGCVEYYMPRNKSTKICGIADENCFLNAEELFEGLKFTCKCLEPCNTIKYDVRVRKVDTYNDKL
jgi:amiloride-sensitive sodium channel